MDLFRCFVDQVASATCGVCGEEICECEIIPFVDVSASNHEEVAAGGETSAAVGISFWFKCKKCGHHSSDQRTAQELSDFAHRLFQGARAAGNNYSVIHKIQSDDDPFFVDKDTSEDIN